MKIARTYVPPPPPTINYEPLVPWNLYSCFGFTKYYSSGVACWTGFWIRSSWGSLGRNRTVMRLIAFFPYFMVCFLSLYYRRLVSISSESPLFTKYSKALFTVSLVCMWTELSECCYLLATCVRRSHVVEPHCGHLCCWRYLASNIGEYFWVV
jgi:hypothetical protein